MGCLPLLFPLPTLPSGILEQLSWKRVKKKPIHAQPYGKLLARINSFNSHTAALGGKCSSHLIL